MVTHQDYIDIALALGAIIVALAAWWWITN